MEGGKIFPGMGRIQGRLPGGGSRTGFMKEKENLERWSGQQGGGGLGTNRQRVHESSHRHKHTYVPAGMREGLSEAVGAGMGGWT